MFDALPVAEFQAMIDEAMQNDPEYDLRTCCSSSRSTYPTASTRMPCRPPRHLVTRRRGRLRLGAPAGSRGPGRRTRCSPTRDSSRPSSGVDAPAAWAVGADGSGIRFIDIEQGWFHGHEDLPNLIRVLAGINLPASHGHGTAVLGTVIGQDNNSAGSASRRVRRST